MRESRRAHAPAGALRPESLGCNDSRKAKESWHFECKLGPKEVLMDTLTAHAPLHRATTRNESITRWSRRARGTLGVITFALIGIFSAAAVHAVVAPTESLSSVGSGGEVQFVLFFATLLQFLLMLFYVSFAAQNPRTEARVSWIASMILMPFASLPIYWFVHVWKAPYVSDPKSDHNVPGGELTPDAD